MTNEEMDKVIAEHLGWKFYPCKDDGYGRATGERWEDPDGDIGPYPPNYSTDLNAMHEAVETLRALPGAEWFNFQGYLKDHCGSVMNCIQAKADVRAIAFLRTIGKYIEPSTTPPDAPTIH